MKKLFLAIIMTLTLTSTARAETCYRFNQRIGNNDSVKSIVNDLVSVILTLTPEESGIPNDGALNLIADNYLQFVEMVIVTCSLNGSQDLRPVVLTTIRTMDDTRE